jgi:hypothetical protein
MKKNNGLLVVGMVLALAPSVLTRTGVELNDFVEGLMMGFGVVGLIAGLWKVKAVRQA